MAQNKAALKSRIKSVTSTKKITGAMELIANAKLQKQRGLMFKNKEYSEALQGMVTEILSGDFEIDNVYLEEKSASSKLFFVFCSDLGLCGGYNINVTKLVSATVNKENDYVILIGKNQYHWFVKNGYKLLNDEAINTDQIEYMDLKKLVEKGLKMFVNNEVGSIEVIYTQFVNNVTFSPAHDKIIPINKEANIDQNGSYKETLFEPSANAILDSLIPMMIQNSIYSRWLQAKTAEQGSRRFAMENATDNATELIDNLVLKFNQARQAAITQEITEIVGGADAL